VFKRDPNYIPSTNDNINGNLSASELAPYQHTAHHQNIINLIDNNARNQQPLTNNTFD
jgi:hypothetical protein